MPEPTTDQAAVDDLFVDEPQWEIPSLADRYEYKKKSGSADSYNTQDVIET